ncbi:hypothetical protein F2Q69_00001937 [Brassica cretica]|uniref:Uncharacterized protein n=1 Tax=Brassica cretica TaxID=69181 RepID=A0A8S9NQ38_BRACR|nr:hypothetical protein F2Q69_00001937 [Brassica cretica]
MVFHPSTEETFVWELDNITKDVQQNLRVGVGGDEFSAPCVGFFVSSVWVSQLRSLSSALDSVMFLLELSSVRSRCSTFGFIIELSIVKLQFGDVVPFLGFKPTGSSGFFGKRDYGDSAQLRWVIE